MVPERAVRVEASCSAANLGADFDVFILPLNKYADRFQTLGSNNVNVMMISQGSSEATISCVVANRDVDRAVRALQLALMGQGYVDKIAEEKDACIIAVVGSGMKGTPGVAARIFTAVAKRKVNIHMVAQGSSEYNVSFVVSHDDGPDAVKAIQKNSVLVAESSAQPNA